MSVVLIQRRTDGRVPVIGTLLLGTAPHEAYGLVQQIEDLFLDLSEAGYFGDIELLGQPMYLSTTETPLSATIITSHLEGWGSRVGISEAAVPGAWAR